MDLASALPVPISYVILALLASGARFMLIRDPPTLKLLFGSLLWGLFLLVSTFEYLTSLFTTADTALVNKGLLNLSVALVSFLAKDLLEILLKLAEQVKVDPLALLRDLLNRYKPKGPDGGDS